MTVKCVITVTFIAMGHDYECNMIYEFIWNKQVFIR